MSKYTNNIYSNNYYNQGNIYTKGSDYIKFSKKRQISGVSKIINSINDLVLIKISGHQKINSNWKI